MTTYYAAQLGIALSVVDSKDSYMKEREASQKQKLLLDESIKTDRQQQPTSIGGIDHRRRKLQAAEN